MKFVLPAILALGLFAAPVHAATGWASYYKSGRLTANGEHFKPMGMTCAHRKLAFGKTKGHKLAQWPLRYCAGE